MISFGQILVLLFLLFILFGDVSKLYENFNKNLKKIKKTIKKDEGEVA